MTTEAPTLHGPYRKEIARAGRFFRANGEPLDFTTDQLHRIAAVTTAYIAAGGVVPVRRQHGAIDDMDARRGMVQRVYVEGDRLIADVTLNDQGVIAAARADVSVYVDAVRGPHGRVYRDVLTHVAQTTDPVVIGLSGYERIAASNANASTTTSSNASRDDLDALAERTRRRLGIADITDAKPDMQRVVTTPNHDRSIEALRDRIRRRYAQR